MGDETWPSISPENDRHPGASNGQKTRFRAVKIDTVKKVLGTVNYGKKEGRERVSKEEGRHGGRKKCPNLNGGRA